MSSGAIERSHGKRSVVGVVALVGVMGVGAAVLSLDEIDGGATATELADRVGDQASVGGPTIADCPVFPVDNACNLDVSALPLHPRSSRIIAKIQSIGGDNLHPDFGETEEYGIPFVIVDADQPRVPITYDAYGDESDPGPFPVPLDAPETLAVRPVEIIGRDLELVEEPKLLQGVELGDLAGADFVEDDLKHGGRLGANVEISNTNRRPPHTRKTASLSTSKSARQMSEPR